jgi:hypothetical protein
VRYFGDDTDFSVSEQKKPPAGTTLAVGFSFTELRLDI